MAPETSGYTGICLVCFEPHTVALGDYPALSQWGQEHVCNSERARIVAALVGERHVRCLYCGSIDVYETRVLVDERTEEMALQCGACHGVWAS
ncbi:hypothetical protein ACFOY4_10175 [Actinomadura syzygii]|uniref:Uncharacterized protein n=1 Tax=Actinomadura syzygii TaxID=1427538 RepID=A0A5D0UDY2_9ACTN|nr:hypothetical protein [Actinomadura syzygii]TYC15825.1 hypothetical protein FXF65_10795 [Actinomadura syzygii]